MIPAPPRFEPLDDREELFDFALGKRGTRFVHHDDARVARQRFRDFDELLLADRQPRHRNIERNLETQLAEHACRQFARRAFVEQTAAHRLGTERDVLRGRQLRHEVELLIDHPDAEPFGAARRVDMHLAAVDGDRARVGRLRARQDLHQRRLARAVFSDEHVHFAGAQRQRHAGRARERRGTIFEMPRHLEQRRFDALATLRIETFRQATLLLGVGFRERADRRSRSSRAAFCRQNYRESRRSSSRRSGPDAGSHRRTSAPLSIAARASGAAS